MLEDMGAEILSLRSGTSERRTHTAFSTLIGWSGWAAALSGVLFLAWGYVHSEGAPWHLGFAVLVLSILVPLLFLVGLTGLFAKCVSHAGWPSLVGFVVSFATAGWLTIRGVVAAPYAYRHLGESKPDHAVVQDVVQECGFACFRSYLRS